jgi:nucleoside permease NupC
VATTIMVIGMVVTAAGALFLVGSLVRSIHQERKRSKLQKIWKNFGLSIAFCVLFLTTWIGQALTEWQVYRSEQLTHGQQPEAQGFTFEFLQSTLENWQSEFLQLFSFVVLSALLIHRGSGESKDSDDRMEASLQRIEKRLEELEVA